MESQTNQETTVVVATQPTVEEEHLSDLEEEPQDGLQQTEEMDDEDDAPEEELDVAGHKFSSPEAGAERLAKLPSNVQTALQLMSEETTFGALVAELQNRCRNARANLPPNSKDRMWLHHALNTCMEFRRTHFQRRSNLLDRVPTEVSTYMSSADEVEILQTLVDVSQQKGYHARQFFDTLNDESTTKRVSQRDYDDALASCKALEQRYHEYVDMFRRCTASGKPFRVRTGYRRPSTSYQTRVSHDRPQRGIIRRDDSGRSQQERPRREERCTQDERPTRQVHVSSERPTERKPYRPGSYQNVGDRRPTPRDGGNKPQQSRDNSFRPNFRSGYVRKNDQ
ncbi:hypothetical protein QJ857_gp1166 [Tupanvirus soda lake]|uniref:Uncharacterized protein n=2 Tax=Tupanvirus TaxID=2094720 RepID=A0A6N1NTF1_9VIRU|nr:hypothetical protein QJ857_gp1166 [Tupanvirus soda lake]QKU34888.1 hypothetical protein [Tupanvirus soda lake]